MPSGRALRYYPTSTGNHAPSRSGSGQARIGIGIHSSQDIEEEASTLHTEMMQFGQELHDQLFQNAFDQPRPDVPEDKIKLYHEVWRPLMNEWTQFHEEHEHWWNNLPLSGAWDRIQDFRQRFLDVRNKAKEMKFKLVSPDPLPVHKDPDITAETKDLLKTAGMVAIGVGGVFLLFRMIGDKKTSPSYIPRSIG